MTDPTPDDLATLARAMGYTVTLDDSGGYGVVRVVIDGGFYGVSSRSVFCPHLDAAQAWEVMAWLLAQTRQFDDDEGRFFTVTPYNVQRQRWDDLYGETVICSTVGHDCTAAGIRRAVVEAAIRVAKG